MTSYNIEQLERNIEEKKAELIVGTNSIKGLNKKDSKLLDEFLTFAKKTYTEYGIDDFFIRIGKVTYDESFNEISKERVVYESKENIGLKFEIENQEGNYYHSNKLKLIGKNEIKEKLSEELKTKKSKELFKKFDININGTEDIIKEIKNELKTKENKFCFSTPHSYSTAIKIINFIFNENYDPKENTEDNNKIIKVFEKDNLRVVFCRDNYVYKIIMAIPEFSIYNYLDEGRKFYLDWGSYSDNKFYIFDDITQEDFKFFDDNNIKNKIKEKIKFITNDEFKSLCSKEKLRKKMKELKQNKENALDEKINSEFEKNNEINLNGIRRTKKGFFEYQKQKIGFKDFDVMRLDKEEKDFNNIFNEVVFSFVNNYNEKQNILFCGDFKIKMEEENNRWYIEDIRINKAEREEVLKKALCYNKKKDYLVFLKEVSKCSIEIHNKLSSGLTYYLNKNQYGEDKIFSNVELIRKKNRHFIKLGKKEFQISNIKNIITMENWSNNVTNTHTIAQGLEKNSELDYNTSLLVLKKGLADYKLAKKKAKQLLEETITKLNIKKIDVENSEIEDKGYLVKGKSGKEYFITEKLKIFNYPSMKYICIIDKGKYSTLNSTDLLISRLYACANDTLLKENIYTL